MDIEKTLNIAQSLDLKDLQRQLERIKERSQQDNAPLILPLVGEFSSGKTTLINVLTDSKILETATRPTTATIYEVHFGCDKCSAAYLDDTNIWQDVNDLSLLKNEYLTNSTLVQLCDTSKRISSAIILVDTPGISSPDPKHKQTLVDFLPQADGIILVSDVNQQLTRSLTDFIDTMKLSKRPIYLVLTMCDTKSDEDVLAVRKYMSENCNLPIQHVAAVSAINDQLEEFYELLEGIQKEKLEIINIVDEQRMNCLLDIMLAHIDELLALSDSDADLDELIEEQEYKLKKIKRNIQKLLSSTSDVIEEKKRFLVRRFEDEVSQKLESLVLRNSDNFDSEALSIVNNISSILLSEYKVDIQHMLCEKANDVKLTEDILLISLFQSLDFTKVKLSGLSYNLNLNTLGHQYDGAITTGIKVAAIVGTVLLAGSYLGGGEDLDVGDSSVESKQLAGEAFGADDMIDVADTVSDVSSIVSNQHAAARIEQAVGAVGLVGSACDGIHHNAHGVSQQANKGKGIIESVVGLITDSTMGKPQRKRAIANYMQDSLLPAMQEAVSRVNNEIISLITDALNHEVEEGITQRTEILAQLKHERQEKVDAYQKKMSDLRNFKVELLKQKTQ